MDVNKIKPLSDRILVKPLKEEEKTKGGIVLPDTVSKEKPQVAEVLAVGPGRTNDKVIYAKYSGTDIKSEDDEDYLLLSEKDVLALLG